MQIHKIESFEADLGQYMDHFIQCIAASPINLIFGQMGTGKTSLVRAIGQHLHFAHEVSSPSFALINEYQIASNSFNISGMYHIDLYRLKNINEAMDIAIEDHLWSGKHCLIEWPELILPLLKGARYQEIWIETLENNKRSYTLKF